MCRWAGNQAGMNKNLGNPQTDGKLAQRGGEWDIKNIEYLKPIHTKVTKNTLRRLLVLVKEKSITQKHSHDPENYPGSDLLSLGVIHPVPEQYLRISLTQGYCPPYGALHTQPQLVFSSQPEEELTTPWTPP
ncbi:hypothetical protein Taro_006407, partial [Colocasia esculenta]|nr:hypothetical protein [Colocasia esculenta]